MTDEEVARECVKRADEESARDWFPFHIYDRMRTALVNGQYQLLTLRRGQALRIQATGGELVWGVATHEYRNHFMPWACPAPCDLSDGGMVRGASHEATASAPFSPRREETVMEQEGRAQATGTPPRGLKPFTVSTAFSLRKWQFSRPSRES